MKPPTFAAALPALLTLLFTTTARADDLKLMEGTWTVESAEAKGKKIEEGDLKELVVTIKGDRYEIQVKDHKDAGTMKVDEKAMPKTLDATDTEGEGVGKVVKAIYEITGDTMRVCYAIEGDERPKEFATKEDSPFLTLTYKRAKKAE